MAVCVQPVSAVMASNTEPMYIWLLPAEMKPPNDATASTTQP
jgi:hypothetical protein